METKDPVAHVAAQRALLEAQRNTRETVLTHLLRLDPADPYTLRFAVTGLLSANFEQKDLAGLVGVSRTTISRWGQGQNIPRSPPFRKWVVEALCNHLTEVIRGTRDEPIAERPLPQHAIGYLHEGHEV
jgi:Trp operon repressor